jgi:hypothetical protein
LGTHHQLLFNAAAKLTHVHRASSVFAGLEYQAPFGTKVAELFLVEKSLTSLGRTLRSRHIRRIENDKHDDERREERPQRGVDGVVDFPDERQELGSLSRNPMSPSTQIDTGRNFIYAEVTSANWPSLIL